MLVVPADYTGQKRASVPPLWSFFCLSDVIDSFCSFFKLDYNYITMLCLFLLYNKVNQLYVYIHPFPLEPPSQFPASSSPPLSQPGHHRAPSWALCATQQAHIVLRIFKECSCLLAQQIFTTALLCSGRPGLLTLFYRWRDSLRRTGARFFKFLA